MENKKEAAQVFGFVSGIGFLLLGIVCLGMYGCPQYTVYHQRLEGEGELARAQANRMIKVQEAEATKEAAVKLADAEINRARGVAEANKIIGESLKGNDMYLRYLWVQALHEKENNVIYVPTEANLPILEAGKRH